MHGLINRTIQGFLRGTYGTETWIRVARRAELPVEGYEAMLHYDDSATETLLAAVVEQLGRPRESILEDIGTWLVSAESGQPLRRMLRFGGVDFSDFLHSLEDLPGRAHLALPDLALPVLELREPHADHYALSCTGPGGFGHVLVGVLRAMADDYGALVMLEHRGERAGSEQIGIRVFTTDHAKARRFALAGDP